MNSCVRRKGVVNVDPRSMLVGIVLRGSKLYSIGSSEGCSRMERGSDVVGKGNGPTGRREPGGIVGELRLRVQETFGL